MNINLDDKKIVRIVYALDDCTELNIEFKDGDIHAISKKYKKESLNALNDIKDMLEKSRSADWGADIVRRRNEIESKIEKDRNDLEKSINAKKKQSNSEIKNLYDCKKLIDMDKEGKLDEIVKEHRERGIPNKYASVFGADSENEDDFKRLNEGLDALKYASEKIADKHAEKENAVKKAIEEEAKKAEQDDFNSSLDRIKENAEKYLDAKELDAKKNEEELRELIPNFEITQILMELVKIGYFDEIEKIPKGIEQSLYRARAIVEAVNKVKAIRLKDNG